jgi:hypothetical protein
MKQRYGDDYFSKKGARGAAARHIIGGFRYMALSDPERLRAIAVLGGKMGRRAKKVKPS